MTEQDDVIEIAIVQLVSGEQIATCIERYDDEGNEFEDGVVFYRPLVFQLINKGDGDMKLFVNKFNHFTSSDVTFVNWNHIVTLDPLSDEYIQTYFETWEEYDDLNDEEPVKEFLTEENKVLH
jgi:hypothetical protein